MSVMHRPGPFISFALASLLAFLASVPGAAGVRAQDASVPAEGLEWKAFEEAVTQSEEQGKKLLVDVYAAWCPWCQRLQREVYTDESVQAYVRDYFVLTRLDAENTEDSLSFRDYTLTPSEMAAGLGASGFPTTVFMDEEGRYITRLPGFMAAPEFLEVLTYIGSDAFVDFTFEEYQAEEE